MIDDVLLVGPGTSGPVSVGTVGDPPGGVSSEPAPARPRLSPAQAMASLAVVGETHTRAEPSSRTPLPMPSIYSHSLLQEHYKQTKAADRARRQAASPEDDRIAPLEIIEPPFDFDALTVLLFDAPDFYAIVSQLATDSVGNGWRLVDREGGDPGGPADLPVAPLTPPAAQPEPSAQTDLDLLGTEPPVGDLLPPAPEPSAPVPPPPATPTTEGDTEAARQRAIAEPLFATIAGDVAENRISLDEMFRCVITDYDSLGHGAIEVARDDIGKIDGLYHVPGRLVRKRAHGMGWAQVDDFGRQVAFFRNFGSDPNDPNSRINSDEATRTQRQEFGQVKNELYVIRHYHPAELHYGVPPIIPALHAVMGNIHSAARNLHYFTNRGMPDWLVEIKGDAAVLNDPEVKPIIDKFVESIDEHMLFQIRGDDYKTLKLRIPRDIIETTWEKLSTDFNSSDFQAYQEDNRDIQLRVYGVPPHALGINEAASLGTGTGESQQERYKRSQLDPRQMLFEQLCDYVLDSHALGAIRFQCNEIDILDEQREMGMYAQASAAGAIGINEERAWLSRIVKDQDFPDHDEDVADIPRRILDQQLGGMLGAGFEPDLLGQGGTTEETGEESATSPSLGGSPFPVRRLSVDPRYRRLHRAMAEAMRTRAQRVRETVAAHSGNGKPEPALPGAEK